MSNEAALKAARDGGRQVTGAELEYAIERVVGGTEKRSQVRRNDFGDGETVWRTENQSHGWRNGHGAGTSLREGYLNRFRRNCLKLFSSGKLTAGAQKRAVARP